MPPTRILLGGLLSVAALTGARLPVGTRSTHQPPAWDTTASRHVHLRFIHSPYADYLFYLLYRDTTRLPQWRDVALDPDLPTLTSLIALPELTASTRIRSYQEILPLVELYHHATARVVSRPAPRILVYGRQMPSYDILRLIVGRGASAFPRFLEVWKRTIEPKEVANIAVWQAQDAACHPMDSLQALARLPFPSGSLDVGAIDLHFSGSGNYTPMGVYTRTFDHPSLAFTLGHEATHLLVNPLTGHDWRRAPSAADLTAAAAARGLTVDDLDELLALFMQVALPQACGVVPSTRRISDAFAADTVRHAVLLSPEDDWQQYQGDPRRWPTLIEYFIDRSLAALAA